MTSLYRSHLQQGWRHVLFHAPYKPIDVLLIGTLIVYTPLIVVLTCGANLHQQLTLHPQLFCTPVLQCSTLRSSNTDVLKIAAPQVRICSDTLPAPLLPGTSPSQSPQTRPARAAPEPQIELAAHTTGTTTASVTRSVLRCWWWWWWGAMVVVVAVVLGLIIEFQEFHQFGHNGSHCRPSSRSARTSIDLLLT